jgi:hypothetical protein
MSSLKPEEDYLDEDKPFRQLVKKQNFTVISMLTPNCFPEDKRQEYKDQKILGIKVRGVFETYEDAKAHSEKLQQLDKFHNIFVGEVGKWLPFDVDISNMQTEDDPVYREKSLNQYMKAYKDTLKEEEVTEKERKEEQLKGANVVTGKTNAPVGTGIGCPEITPAGVIPNMQTESSLTEKVNEYAENDVDVVVEDDEEDDQTTSQLKNANNEKIKIEEDLEQSKNNMKELQSKLETINQIYSELKK